MSTVWGLKHKGRIYDMEMGAPEFAFILDKETKRLAVIISRSTQYPNIWWFHYLTFGLRWPWLRNVSCFRDIDEPEPESASQL